MFHAVCQSSPPPRVQLRPRGDGCVLCIRTTNECGTCPTCKLQPPAKSSKQLLQQCVQQQVACKLCNAAVRIYLRVFLVPPGLHIEPHFQKKQIPLLHRMAIAEFKAKYLHDPLILAGDFNEVLTSTQQCKRECQILPILPAHPPRGFRP